MKILFYQNSLRKKFIWASQVHIIEVLNNLLKLGHNIIYANGEYHSLIVRSQTKTISQLPRTKSRWEKVKRFIHTIPLRGEALISFYFIQEVKIFLVAFRAVLRYKPNLIYRRHSMFSSEYFLSRIFKIPCVMEVNGIISDEFRIDDGGDAFSLWLINKIERHDFKRADKYIVVTAKLKDLLFNEYDVPLSNIVVIENGANTDLFRPMDKVTVKKELNLDIRNNFICFVGSLAIWHGVKYFISAMPLILKVCPNTRALIVGPKSLTSELISLTNQLGVSDKTTFTGRIPYEKVPWYINASDICVIPSCLDKRMQRIGLSSLKLCEYLACGKPVVASRISGFEFIEENDCGYLVNQECPEELADAIIALLRDPVSKQRMGENGRKYVFKNRSWEIQSKKVAEVCENVIQERKKPKK